MNGEIPSYHSATAFGAHAQELDVPASLYPGRAESIAHDDELEGVGDLGNIIGNPPDTIFGGTLDRFGRLTVVGIHGGGRAPS